MLGAAEDVAEEGNAAARALQAAWRRREGWCRVVAEQRLRALSFERLCVAEWLRRHKSKRMASHIIGCVRVVAAICYGW